MGILNQQWPRPWWFPGPLLRAYGLVALGFIGHLIRISRDPWTHVWRMPGRSLFLLLVQALPLAFMYLVAWALLGRWISRPAPRLIARWVLGSAVLAFCVFDGTYASYADRHLLEAGQLSFLFREGAFWASGVLSIRLLAAMALLLSAIAWLLVSRIPDVPRPVPYLAVLGSVVFVLVVDLAALLSVSGARRDLYAFAISGNPLHGLSSFARDLALGARPGVRTEVRGLVPLRELVRPGLPQAPSRAFVEPRLILIVLLDGFRADFLTPDRAPAISRLAAERGVILEDYYTSYTGTDRSVYSLLFSRHPFFADQTFKMGTRPVARWIGLLRRRGYKAEAFQSNPETYRFLPLVYQSFDAVHYGTANTDPIGSDAAIIRSLETRILQMKPEDRLFAFVLLHSTHFPYKGERLGSPTDNYTAAVRYLDEQAGAFLRRLSDRGESFLAFVGGDHGTLLGECGKAGYSAMHSYTLHPAMAAIGSPDTAPALERLREMRQSMVLPQSLLPLVLDPSPWPPRPKSPEMQWNLAVSAGVAGLDAPMTAHNSAGDAMRVELGRGAAIWQCGRLDDCSEYSASACRPDFLAGAGDALLRLQKPDAPLSRPPAR
jgi:hypothetical protein